MGLLAIAWEKWAAHRGPSSERVPSSFSNQTVFFEDENEARGRARNALASQAAGLGLFLLITVGWFWLAYREAGQPFIDKVIGRELVGHVVSDEHGTFGIGFIKAPLYWLSRFLPWSVLAVVGLWRAFRHPAATAQERRFERFLACWILGGMLLFSLAKHQRGDLPLPLYPPAALLAAREVARWLGPWSDGTLVKRGTGFVLVWLALYTVYLHTVFASTDEVRESEAIEALARQLRAGHVAPNHLQHVDSPYALQFHLNTMNRAVSFEEATAALQADPTIMIAVSRRDPLTALSNQDETLRVLARWPEVGEARVQVVARQRPAAE
jgi:4-amino-4-deoxy-L-arabinose transferase-like glycosyltransferase